MSPEELMNFVQSIKGAPACVLWALACTRRAMTNRELQQWTGYHHDSITQVTRALVDQGWITAGSQMGPWSLSTDQLLIEIFGAGAVSKFSATPSGISATLSGMSATVYDKSATPRDFSATPSGLIAGAMRFFRNSARFFRISPPFFARSSIGFGGGSPYLKSEAPPPIPNLEARENFLQSLTALLKAGIREPAASRLAYMPHITPEYVRAHVEQVTKEGRKIGAAIFRMQRGWRAPGPRARSDRKAELEAKISKFLGEAEK